MPFNREKSRRAVKVKKSCCLPLSDESKNIGFAMLFLPIFSSATFLFPGRVIYLLQTENASTGLKTPFLVSRLEATGWTFFSSYPLLHKYFKSRANVAESQLTYTILSGCISIIV